MAVPVVLDCDTGTDDAVAIALAALHPDLELLGVTTVWGNHEVAHTTDNTLRVLDHLGFTAVPVHAGLGGPYAGREPALPGGRPDLPPTLDLPPATRGADSHDAVGWLVDTVTATEHVALVATGPWSNLAAALAVEPDLLAHVDRLVLLGGAHRRAGVTAWAERNVWSDPLAARAVLAAGVATDCLVVTMDATFSAPLGHDDATVFAQLGTTAGDLAARMLRERIEWYSRDPEMASLGAAPLHDPLAVAALLEPRVVTAVPARVSVDLGPGERLGRTVLDQPLLDQPVPDQGGEPTPADGALGVALGADSTAYRSLLRRVLGAPGTPGLPARHGAP